MELTPSDIARRSFALVRRGFDPQEVTPFLESIAAQLANQQQQLGRALEETETLQGRLDEARSTEEALRMTMVAATQVKEEMVRKATTEAEEMVSSARAEADRIRRDANAEAEHALTAARRDALELLEESRRDARDVIVAAREENNDLVERLEMLRRAVREVETALQNAADAADEHLAGAGRRLADLERSGAMTTQPAEGPDRRSAEARWPDPREPREPERRYESERRVAPGDERPASDRISFEAEPARASAERWSGVTELRQLNG
jgi:DivIVA domain-containing protein